MSEGKCLTHMGLLDLFDIFVLPSQQCIYLPRVSLNKDIISFHCGH